MKQGRLFIAIALSFLVFFAWEIFFVEKKLVGEPKQILESQQESQQVIKEEPIEKDFKTKVFKEEYLHKDDSLQPLQKHRTITVNSPFYSVQISEKGATFNSFVLKNYREKIEGDSPLKEIISQDIHTGALRLGLIGNSLPGLEDALFLTNSSSDSVNIYDEPKEISFSWVSPQGVTVEKKFLFSPETYIIRLNVTIKNNSDRTIHDNLTLSLVKDIPKKTSAYGFEGPSALINDNLEQIKIKKIEDKNIYTGKVKWIAVQDRYFMSSIIPEMPVEASMRLFLKQDSMLESQYVQPASVINSGTWHVFKYNLFFGPKSTKVLNEVDYDLSKAINFGMFDIIAKPCLWIMNFLHDHFIPNYGVAIIILTIFTKIVLWPLGTKSYKSMAEMKKIQPLMVEIKEKYKGDKKKISEEVMGLYKIYKVNPVSGCLPMIVQIPVFFALYRMLYEAIELRHAPFFGWIVDLSAPDRLLRFGFSIPFMEAPYGIPVLTIIMGGTMFLQQKMSPPPGDPMQAKMMMFMPIVFTFIFINFSSGLVLYWLINNVLSITQQYYVTKKIA